MIVIKVYILIIKGSEYNIGVSNNTVDPDINVFNRIEFDL